MTDLDTNKAIAARYLDLIAQGDADAVAALFTEDGAIVLQSHTMLPPETRGREAIRGMIASLPQIFPETGLRITVDVMTAEEDRVAIVAHSDAIHVSGKPYRNRYHFLLYIRDGKIFESHEYLDSLLLTDIFFDGARPDAA
ncbi:nuclear transport factor 2 family protein [Sphingomonas profundi]|uniref:nuclear transport factor 2 family protein n=1 Tax=Alterirhizorhabdus profundi TaxID=2681549 RepID=UPI0012E6F38E|nr:nuclear transport factor 2 family protein [Sphingomonas profundi]